MSRCSGEMQAIRAQVPLAEMFGYATEMRSATQGRGAHTMEFDHYAPVPDEVDTEDTGRACGLFIERFLECVQASQAAFGSWATFCIIRTFALGMRR